MVKSFKSSPDTKNSQQGVINKFEQENADRILREKTKADLEKRIAEKLSRLSAAELEGIFDLHQQKPDDK